MNILLWLRRMWAKGCVVLILLILSSRIATETAHAVKIKILNPPQIKDFPQQHPPQKIKIPIPTFTRQQIDPPITNFSLPQQSRNTLNQTFIKPTQTYNLRIIKSQNLRHREEILAQLLGTETKPINLMSRAKKIPPIRIDQFDLVGDPDEMISLYKSDKKTPAMPAVDLETQRRISELVQDKNFEKLCGILKKNLSLVSLPLLNGKTLLHVAIESGEMPLLSLLLKNKVDLTIKNKAGQTPLDVALQYGNVTAFRWLVLLDKGVRDPLQYVDKLIDRQKNVVVLELLYRLKLFLAFTLDRPDVVKKMWQEDKLGNVHKMDDARNRPLHWAARMGSWELVKSIVEKLESQSTNMVYNYFNPRNIFKQSPADIAWRMLFESQETKLYKRILMFLFSKGVPKWDFYKAWNEFPESSKKRKLKETVELLLWDVLPAKRLFQDPSPLPQNLSRPMPQNLSRPNSPASETEVDSLSDHSAPACDRRLSGDSGKSDSSDEYFVLEEKIIGIFQGQTEIEMKEIRLNKGLAMLSQ